MKLVQLYTDLENALAAACKRGTRLRAFQSDLFTFKSVQGLSQPFLDSLLIEIFGLQKVVALGWSRFIGQLAGLLGRRRLATAPKICCMRVRACPSVVTGTESGPFRDIFTTAQTCTVSGDLRGGRANFADTAELELPEAELGISLPLGKGGGGGRDVGTCPCQSPPLYQLSAGKEGT